VLVVVIVIVIISIIFNKRVNTREPTEVGGGGKAAGKLSSGRKWTTRGCQKKSAARGRGSAIFQVNELFKLI